MASLHMLKHDKTTLLRWQRLASVWNAVPMNVPYSQRCEQQ